jgi:hypothetical protein
MASLRTLVLACCVLAACGRPAVVPAPLPATRADSIEPSRVEASSIVGAWLGYGDGLAFGSESERVQLIITSLGPGGQITGTIAFGEPGTAASVEASDMADSEGDDGGIAKPVEQFSYTLTGRYDAGLSRLEVAFAATEVWSDWCASQTSYVAREGRHACLPDCPFERGPVGCRLVDCPARPGKYECGQRYICGQARVCDCDASTCRHNERRRIELDLHHEGDALKGPIATMGNVFLKRG